VPLKTTDGHNLGTLCVLDFNPREFQAEETATLEDLAGIVVNELELRLAGRRASDVSREREILSDAFVGMLSHEIRTPATIIYAASQVLAKDPDLKLNTKVRDLFDDITSESGRLLRLLDDLLVLTRVERDGLELDEEPVLLQRIVRRCVDLERRRAPGRMIAVNGGDYLPPVSGDQAYIEQVMSNLLSNAVKYSPPDKAITVTMVAVDEQVEVRVSDLGLGIPPGDREAVFGLMFREPTAVKLAPGAGIGLYVCRRLLEAMHGRIWVEGAPGGGTDMVFRLMTLDA
jgi:signal transduction histidine kinase